MDTRVIKQITIALVFFFILGSIGYFSYQKYFSLENLCVNGRQDKNEEGIDCGAICNKSCVVIKDLEIENKKLIKVAVLSGSDQNLIWDYDILVEIKNPNFNLGAVGSYEFKFLNAGSQIISSKTGNFYILPGERKFILESPVRVNQEIVDFDFRLNSPDWQNPVVGFSGELFFSNQKQEYEILGRNGEFSRLQGIVLNNSAVNFDKVEIIAVLYDEQDNILAAGKSSLDSFLAKSERFFEIKWPDPFEGKITRVDVQAYTNIFDDANFLKEKSQIQEF